MEICPVCGYDGLVEPPFDSDGNPSYEICSCCGYEFGFDEATYQEYRKTWIDRGAQWFNVKKRPLIWSLSEQLHNIHGK